jgi:hypothetical protein
MGKITYKVIITKTEHDVEYTAKTWNKLRDYKDELHDEQYGYVETEAVKDVTTEVFTQTLDELDLAKVVLTINAPAKAD